MIGAFSLGITGQPTHLESVSSILIIDLFPRVGDLVDAFVKCRAMMKQQVFYIGFCADQTELTWLENKVEGKLADKYEQDAILPGGILPFFRWVCRGGQLYLDMGGGTWQNQIKIKKWAPCAPTFISNSPPHLQFSSPRP